MESPAKAPMICPPTFSATTNIRSGTSSASSNFQTSFCNSTQALNSSIPVHLRTTMFLAAFALSVFINSVCVMCALRSWLLAFGFAFAVGFVFALQLPLLLVLLSTKYLFRLAPQLFHLFHSAVLQFFALFF